MTRPRTKDAARERADALDARAASRVTLVTGASRSRQRGRRQNVVETHVIRELAVMVREIEGVTERHVRARNSARLRPERHRELLAELGVVQLRESTLAERERFLELRNEGFLGPLRLDRV